MTIPDQTNAEVSDERLREIIDGCEGVQGGPWKLDAFACYVWAPSEKGGDFPLMDELGEKGRVAELRGWGHYTGNGHGALGLDPDEARRRQKLTGEHVARLDPATVKALATELLTRRSVTSQESCVNHPYRLCPECGGNPRNEVFEKCSTCGGTGTVVTSQASEGEGDSGTIHDDESTAAAMERAQRLRERGWKLEAAAERLEQEAHDRAIKRGEHTGTDGI